MAAQPIEDLAVLLESLDYTNVQRWAIQDTPDACVALTPHDTTTGLGRSEWEWGQEAPARAQVRILVQVRGVPENPEEPGLRASAIWLALHRQLATLNGALYRWVRPRQTLVALKADGRRRFTYVFYVDAYPESL